MGQPRTLYEILDLKPDATPVDIHAGFQRAMEAFSDDALASYALFSPDEAEQVRKEIQQAYAVLSQPAARSAYDAALATATDKAAATLSFTTQFEQPYSGTTSISDGRMGAREEPAPAPSEEPRRGNTGRMLVIAPPVEDAPSRSVEAATSDAPAADTLPPMPAVGAPAVETPVVNSVPTPAPVTLTPAEFTLIPTPAAATPLPPMLTLVAPVATLEPVAAEAIPVVPKFKRVRVDDDSVALTMTRAAAPSAVASAPPAPVQEVLALQENAEVNGAVLQRLREGRGITLKAMAEATKVSVHYLKAIESNAFNELPTRVYLRGFLIQIARALKVSPDRLANGYLAFADRFKTQLR